MIADDVTRTARLARDTLATATRLDWHTPAGGLDWTCWETVEHMSDDLFAYAAQLAPADPSTSTHVPFGWYRRREGGPLLTVFVEPAEGPSGLLRVFEACAAMLAAMIDAVPPDRRSFHSYGPSDASGFAAMGVVEILVHMHDVAAGLGLPWSPPADLCIRALHRLFPSAPSAGEPWPTLLWATGRADLQVPHGSFLRRPRLPAQRTIMHAWSYRGEGATRLFRGGGVRPVGRQ
jgi:mycothiol maleylpyruvate isomerase-like protein